MTSAAALVERRGRSPEPPGERALLMLGGRILRRRISLVRRPLGPGVEGGGGMPPLLRT